MFCFGTVDMAASNAIPNVPVGESAANAREILQRAKEYGNVVMLSAPPVKNEEHNQRIEALCTAYSSICRSIDVPFIDLFHPLMEAGYLEDLEDGIHPGPKSNAMIAALLTETEALQQTFTE